MSCVLLKQRLLFVGSHCRNVTLADRYFPFPAFMVSPFVKPGDSINERVALQSAEYAAFKAALDLTSKVS